MAYDVQPFCGAFHVHPSETACKGTIFSDTLCNFKRKKKDEDWTWKDTAGDVVWNALTIIPRVITLALFASYQLNWFLRLMD